MRKDPSTLLKIKSVIFIQAFPKDLQPFTRVNGTPGEGKELGPSGTTGHWLCTDTNPRRYKTSLWPSSQSRGLREVRQIMEYELRAISQHTQWVVNQSRGYLPSSKVHNRNRHTQKLTVFLCWFLASGAMAIVTSETNRKTLELPPPKQQ